MPNPCKVIVKPNTTAYFRHQPFLDDRSTVDPNGENWLFSYDGVTLLAAQRPWLWHTGQLPQGVDTNNLLAVSAAQVPWDLPDDLWLQVRVPMVTNGVAAEVWAWTTTQEVTLADPTGCPLVNAPRPDINMTIMPAGVFNPTPQRSIFGDLPAAVIGNCKVHDGSVIPCTPLIGNPTSAPRFLTLDIVPRNVEFCTDARSIPSRIPECDPNLTRTLTARIPIQSPVAGCALYQSTDFIQGQQIQVANVIIEVDLDKNGYTQNCDNAVIQAQSPRYQIVLSHVVNSSISTARYITVNAGDEIGYICNWTDWNNSNLCGPRDLSSPPHLATQIRRLRNGSIYESVFPYIDTLRAFLAYSHCLYDDWQYTGNDVLATQATPDLEACIQ
jgi:hypothetical protein